ncbi:snoaL-like domain protein [Mycobacterium kansasii 732]|uniref:Steroid Delta-isomerase n=1 Tax=Mycobacterium pseudokansasii TaxID=2341080 RepID=A0A498QYX1_9MYCO|nr:nuclear transport factor 2 family protein [Mycobacterium pseudokansasii]EUA11443.1 snoaL-like domain protein [Mycobacterium kansasii 732]KZS64463.1 steroid delta-isomerase [Mycobacterium kansasii]MBY0387782.1 nuclear transport factor 2 family protein [Mycobacterium pseudokansasii]VBA29769.1 Steroid Delta-isomerase [Mycobacterium pseudokansasii]VBA31218.1 Steroid Delta-isomerase [Mycobacterium pseudokansasii]
MPDRTDRAQAIAGTVHRYIEVLNDGDVEDLVNFYAADATLEDPVGGEVHIGTQAIRGFYSAIVGLERVCELVSLRVSGNEAAFQFRLTVTAGDNAMRVEPIEVMVFDDRGKVTAMKAYWSATDVTRL